MYIKKTYPQYLFIKEKDLKFSYSGLDEATGEKDYRMAWQQK